MATTTTTALATATTSPSFSTPHTRGLDLKLVSLDYRDCTDHFFGTFIESEFKKYHEICSGAPCDWSADQGATHTVLLRNVKGIAGDSGMRGVKIAKSRIYVITDEDESGNAVWSTWTGRWDGGVWPAR